MKRLKTKSGWVSVGEHKGQWTIIAEADNANVLTRGTARMKDHKIKEWNECTKQNP